MVASVPPSDASTGYRGLWSGVAILIIFSVLASLGFWMIERAHLKHVRAITNVLDHFDQSQFLLRADEAKGGSDMQELASHVNDMVSRVKAMTESLSELSVYIAHDLRTPLSLLSIQMDQIEKAAREGVNVTEIASTGRKRIQALTRRCVQLMDVVRVETTSSASFALVDLANELDLLVEDVFEDVAAAKGITFELDLPERAEIMGVRVILQQLMSNLMENAIKFAHECSVIRTGITKETGRTIFWVEDKGAIVPAERLTSIFERGESSPVTQGSGYGLGLPIVRKSARRHGGDASATALPDGMRFEAWFTNGTAPDLS